MDHNYLTEKKKKQHATTAGGIFAGVLTTSEWRANVAISSYSHTR